MNIRKLNNQIFFFNKLYVIVFILCIGAINTKAQTESTKPVIENRVGQESNPGTQNKNNPLTPPTVVFPSTTICEGETLILDAGECGYMAYEWKNSNDEILGTNQQLDVTGLGSDIYTAEVSYNADFSYFKQFEVIVSPTPVVNAGVDQAICKGETTTLTATGGADIVSYDWNNGKSGASVLIGPSSSFEYIVTVVDTNGCVGYDSVWVTVNDLPEVDLGADTAICGDSLLLDAGAGMASYTWSTGEDTPSIYVKTTGTYTATVIDNNGCSDSDQMEVTAVNPVPEADLGPDLALCEGVTSLNHLYSFSEFYDGGNNTLHWKYDGMLLPAFAVVESGTYTFDVIVNATGCTGHDTVEISLEECTQLIDVQCNSTLTSMYGKLIYEEVTGATGYEVEIYQGGNLFTSFTSTNRWYRIQDIAGLQYSTTYEVRVRPLFGTEQGVWGEMCSITTPELGSPYFSKKSCKNAYPNAIGAKYIYFSKIYAATHYIVEFTSVEDGTVYTANSTNNVIVLADLQPALIPDGLYNARIKAYVYGEYTNWGPTCQLFIGSPDLGDDITSCNPVTLDAGVPFAEYQWYLNGIAIEGATDQTYTATQSGEYSVFVDYNNEYYYQNKYDTIIVNIESCATMNPINCGKTFYTTNIVFNYTIPFGTNKCKVRFTSSSGTEYFVESTSNYAVMSQARDIYNNPPVFGEIYTVCIASSKNYGYTYTSYNCEPSCMVGIGVSLSQGMITQPETENLNMEAETQAKNSPVSLKVYPNPVSENKVSIQFDGITPESNINFMVLDSKGKKVFSRNTSNKNEVLDISELNSGIYFIKGFVDGKGVQQKFIVNR